MGPFFKPTPLDFEKRSAKYVASCHVCLKWQLASFRKHAWEYYRPTSYKHARARPFSLTRLVGQLSSILRISGVLSGFLLSVQSNVGRIFLTSSDFVHLKIFTIQQRIMATNDQSFKDRGDRIKQQNYHPRAEKSSEFVKKSYSKRQSTVF